MLSTVDDLLDLQQLTQYLLAVRCGLTASKNDPTPFPVRGECRLELCHHLLQCWRSEDYNTTLPLFYNCNDISFLLFGWTWRMSFRDNRCLNEGWTRAKLTQMTPLIMGRFIYSWKRKCNRTDLSQWRWLNCVIDPKHHTREDFHWIKRFHFQTYAWVFLCVLACTAKSCGWTEHNSLSLSRDLLCMLCEVGVSVPQQYFQHVPKLSILLEAGLKKRTSETKYRDRDTTLWDFI